MFITLPQVEDRRWVLPACPGCPPPPHIPQKPTYGDLRKSGDNGCGKCRLFTQGIEAVCSSGARSRTVEWVWNYSVLSGRDRDRGGRGDDHDDGIYEIEFFIHADSKKLLVSDVHLPAEFHVGHPIPDRTDHEETINQIRRWYSSCVASHENCKSNEEPYMPTRLLDIQSPLSRSGVRLETRTDITGPPIEYVCLSHCWAQSRPACITLKSTLPQNMKGISWASIPKTFQDVINVLRKLDFRYLWIDSLCIVQDDAADWAREAASMCDVYSRAALTVAATASPDSHHGLHFSSSLSSSSPDFTAHHFTLHLLDASATPLRVWSRRPLPHFADTETHATPHHNPTATNEPTAESPPLLRRGWVLQERLLSRRVVHFARHEVVWECLHGCECQCLSGSNDNNNNPSNAGQNATVATTSSSERFINPKVRLGAFLHGPRTEYLTAHPGTPWLEIVEDYTGLALTFARDRFPALSGAARRSRQFRLLCEKGEGEEQGKGKEGYCAGIWKSEIHVGLSWVSSVPLGRRRFCGHGDRSDYDDNWVAPSWSWAAVEGGVWWPGKYLCVETTFLQVLETHIVLADEDPTGRLKAAKMRVRGKLVEAVLLWEKDIGNRNLDMMFSLRFGSSRTITGCFWPDYALHDPVRKEDFVSDGAEVLWLPVLDFLLPGGRGHEIAGLVLRKSMGVADAYERIGGLRVTRADDYGFMMMLAEERELVIV